MPIDEDRTGLVEADQFHPYIMSAHLRDDVLQRTHGRDIPEMRRCQVDPDVSRRVAQIELVRENLGAGEENLAGDDIGVTARK